MFSSFLQCLQLVLLLLVSGSPTFLSGLLSLPLPSVGDLSLLLGILVQMLLGPTTSEGTGESGTVLLEFLLELVPVGVRAVLRETRKPVILRLPPRGCPLSLGSTHLLLLLLLAHRSVSTINCF